MQIDYGQCSRCYFSNKQIEKERVSDTICICWNCDLVSYEPFVLETYPCPIEDCFSDYRKHSKLELQHHLVGHNPVTVARSLSKLWVKLKKGNIDFNSLMPYTSVDEDWFVNSNQNQSERGKI